MSRSRRAANTPYPHLVWGHRPQTLAAKWPEGCGGGILRVLLTPSPVCRQMGCFNPAPYGSDPGTPPQKKMGWGNTRARQRGKCEGDFNAQPHGTWLGSSFPSLLHRSHPWVLFSVKVGGGISPSPPPQKSLPYTLQQQLIAQRLLGQSLFSGHLQELAQEVEGEVQGVGFPLSPLARLQPPGVSWGGGHRGG